MRRVAEFIATASGWLSRQTGRGGGTTLPGTVLLKLRPDAIAEHAADLRHGSLLISATNGKTTTTRLVAAAAKADGYHIVTNATGSNLERGIAAAFLQKEPDVGLGLFEVDEAALPAVANASRPAVIVLMNLFRDQLDRYGELETLVSKWQSMLDDVHAQHEPPLLVLNADDPNIAALGQDRRDVVWFGINDITHGLEERAHAADATTCRNCGSPLDHSMVAVGHLGHWDCPNCSSTRPEPVVAAKRIALSQGGQSVTITYRDEQGKLDEITINSSLPGLHNSYNIVAGFAAMHALAQRTRQPHNAAAIAEAMAQTQAAFGRGELIDVGDKRVRLLLAKNPTGVNQNVRTVLTEPDDVHVLVLLNDRTADGKDVSWVWDVDWEPLLGRLKSLTIGGDRAWDLALRFRYGGFDMDKIKVSPDIAKALDLALEGVGTTETLHALPTYTAMLDLRWVLTERGYASPYWSDDDG